MSDVAIRAEGLGKMYRIGGPQERYQTFRDAITRAVTAPFKRAHDLLRGQAYGAAGLQEEIWALKDVSFEVKHGEVVGIIGRNGAGKSTLLKVLSRITEPSEGYVDVYGRVGALLEVGTGFHPELTGRENVYLNGAILGMTRNDINRKFDEIVDFAGVEKFIDTPVKHYSSGMRLRLGFAVAAFLEPDILVVDEVLAVGDVAFQRKCLGKMQDVAGAGRTVIFVSHDLTAVRNLCTRGIVLEYGTTIVDGTTELAINQYMQSVVDVTENNQDLDIFQTDERFQIREITFLNQNEEPSDHIVSGKALKICIAYSTNFNEPIHNVHYLRLYIRDKDGNLLFVCDSLVSSGERQVLQPHGEIICSVPSLPLTEGRYIGGLYVKLGTGKSNLVRYDDLFQFDVIDGDFFGTGRKNRPHWGSFLVNHNWEVLEIEKGE